MFKHLWVECGMLSGLTNKTCILAIVTNNKPILSSMLAAGIVQERLLEKLEKRAREAKWRRLEATSTTRAGNSSRFIAMNFYRKSLTRAHLLETYVRMYTYTVYMKI